MGLNNSKKDHTTKYLNVHTNNNLNYDIYLNYLEEEFPIHTKSGFSHLNETNILLFTLGYNEVYSESVLFLKAITNNKKYFKEQFQDDLVTRNIKFSPELENFIKLDHNLLEQIGWIIINKSKWGFVLNLNKIERFYNSDKIDNLWKELLKHKFMINILEKFAFHNEGDEEIEDDNILYILKTTDTEIPLPNWFIPFNDKLFLHQKQEVAWMFKLERDYKIKIKKNLNFLPFLDTGLYIDFNNLDNFVKVNDNDNYFIDLKGGILASGIGMGKTISTLALISISTQLKSDKSIFQIEYDNYIKNFKEENKIYYDESYIYPYANIKIPELSLIIVTKNILHQWKDEIKTFCPFINFLFLEEYRSIENDEINDFDIILTHRDLFIENKNFLKGIIFNRVIIDEIHEILGNELYDNFNLNHLKTNFTWGLTGTPENLKYYKNASLLFNLIGIGFSDSTKTSKILKEFMNKSMRRNTNPVELPKLKLDIIFTKFNQIQNILYKNMLIYVKDMKSAKLICSNLLPQFENVDMNSQYEKIISHISNRKKIEIDNLLEKYKLTNNINIKARIEILQSEDNFYNDLQNIINKDNFFCPICLNDEILNNIVVFDCMHNICNVCYCNMNKSIVYFVCPICKIRIYKDKLLISPELIKNKDNKLKFIIDNILKTPINDKIIIYSQFNELAEKLCSEFYKSGISFVTLRGEASDINISISKFYKLSDIKVLIMSIEQAASGINVTCANHVYFVHPIFGLEFDAQIMTYKQCIGRVYRIGQNKKVYSKLFVTENSIEEGLIYAFKKIKD